MEVQLKPHRPIDVIRKVEVDGGLYQIHIDGRLAGFIGYHDGAKPMLLARRSPLECQEIENKVRQLLSGIQKVGEGVAIPPVPPPPEQQPPEIDLREGCEDVTNP